MEECVLFVGVERMLQSPHRSDVDEVIWVVENTNQWWSDREYRYLVWDDYFVMLQDTAI